MSNTPAFFIMRRIFYLFFFISLFTACRNDLKEVEMTTRLYEPGKESGKNIKLIYTENGQKKVLLTAPKLVRSLSKDAFVEFPDGLNVRFYNEAGLETSNLQADYAIRYEKDQKTYFRDNVLLRNKKGEQLETDELIWDEKAKKIYSDKFVRIITPDEHLTGKGFEADQEFTHYTIKNLSGKIYVKGKTSDENL